MQYGSPNQLPLINNFAFASLYPSTKIPGSFILTDVWADFSALIAIIDWQTKVSDSW